MTRRRGTVWLIGVTLFGLLSAACARVQPHLELPTLAAEDAAFLPTVEGYTSTAHGGNSATLLLNGDQIFPAHLAAIRSARATINYAQYFYKEGPIGRQSAEALADRCGAGIRGHILVDGFGALAMPAAYRQTMTQAGCEVATFRPLSPQRCSASLASAGTTSAIIAACSSTTVSSDSRGVGCEPEMDGQWTNGSRRPATSSAATRTSRHCLGADPPPLRSSGGASRCTRCSCHVCRATVDLHHHSGRSTSPIPTSPRWSDDPGAHGRRPVRGVRVVVLLPGAIDNNIVRQASRSQFGTLLEAGIEIYEYRAALLHAKTMTVDGIWATIAAPTWTRDHSPSTRSSTRSYTTRTSRASSRRSLPTI